MTGKNGQQFFQIIVDMGNIGVLAPYYFIVIAFVSFKKRKDIAHPIIFFHSMKLHTL
ncbi:MAG: glutamate/gamma-aminobutyrate family transporter YjeM [Acetilactobacillus jinshanensis]